MKPDLRHSLVIGKERGGKRRIGEERELGGVRKIRREEKNGQKTSKMNETKLTNKGQISAWRNVIG